MPKEQLGHQSTTPATAPEDSLASIIDDQGYRTDQYISSEQGQQELDADAEFNRLAAKLTLSIRDGAMTEARVQALIARQRATYDTLVQALRQEYLRQQAGVTPEQSPQVEGSDTASLKSRARKAIVSPEPDPDPDPGPTPDLIHATYSELTPEESQKILNKTQIKGSVYEEGRNFYSGILDVGILQDCHLEPKHLVQIGDTKIALSDIYYTPIDDRPATVAYVEEESEICARTFYRSNSQGIWRYLPAYTSEPGHPINWFSKSNYGEQAINAPFGVQEALEKILQSQLEADGHAIHLPRPAAELAFVGTAERLPGTYNNHLGENPGSDLYRETHPVGQMAHGIHWGSGAQANELIYPDPTKLTVPPEISPDFDQPIASWQAQTQTYGPIQVECFQSADSQLGYMFCRDQRGRAWLGGVECIGTEVNSVGLRSWFVDPGALTTPLYEYSGSRGRRYDGGWGDPTDRRDHYVGMWHYTSQIPMVAAYHDYIQSRSAAVA